MVKWNPRASGGTSLPPDVVTILEAEPPRERGNLMRSELLPDPVAGTPARAGEPYIEAVEAILTTRNPRASGGTDGK